MVAWRSTREWNTPRWRRCLVSLAKKPSTAFSHEAGGLLVRPLYEDRAPVSGDCGGRLAGKCVGDAAGALTSRTLRISTRIPQMDRASRPEGRRNANETADSFFHPSRPPELGCLVRHKRLTQK